MSRTDKDRPYWVSDKYVARHVCHQVKIACDLPEFVSVKFTKRSRNFCYWRPYHPNRPIYWNKVPPRWYVLHRYHNPQRVHKRDTLREALKDYNANGNTEIETVDRQGRNSAQWDWN